MPRVNLTLAEAMHRGTGREVPFRCPVHEDLHASASLNRIKGKWCCSSRGRWTAVYVVRMGSKNHSTVAERFWAKVDKTDSCWLWTASTTRGYGAFRPGSSRTTPRVYAHRWAYEQEFGPIPKLLQLDHLCRVRHCVRPSHLEPVTQRENLLRGETVVAVNSRKTECHLGHPFVPENTYVDPKGARYCLRCRRERDRRRRVQNSRRGDAQGARA